MVRSDGQVTATELPSGLRSDGSVDAAVLNRLAADALGKSPDAVRQFLLAIAPSIRRTCGSVMGRDHSDLEDTIQESLVDTMRALPRYRFEGNVIHFVTKIALRLAIKARRRGTVRWGRLMKLGEQQVDVPAQEDGPVHRAEQTELVRHILQDLNPRQTEALVLHLVLGFSVDEVASMTETRVHTVKTRLRLGRFSLKRRLERIGQSPSKRKGPAR
jgi:RNA polymerase sigma-70 factor (ECF subfamily)